ncbi:glutamate--tRNA ligase [Desulfuromonas sp. CSMB_57]|jgi:glutamyl-tRNA synthetase|uniref:glutamate--tRNA ligase n=1 Tax=Desulfuromonas sp. CSMB_57 TaxID=2807629 RepID=UPI001CD29765|nr:glutamate--tRNA ligase [Desulfuromonas sp. CSMB_57]
MSKLRVRFAPSPTGYLHIGGARTALFNYLLARKEGGSFILRIEDTDVARSTQESVDAILQAMEWLGMQCDEGPVFQSARFDLYRQKVRQLLDQGLAYRCYCTAEELEAKREQALQEGRKPKYDGTCRALQGTFSERPFVVRFRAPGSGATTFEDRIKGPITFQNEELDDLIIQRSDGTPTYNFVVVVDDAEMAISLVVRGDDHINNTPRQILLYQALGYPVPDFAHVPMILGADKSRLSKRHGATSVMAYRDMGYLPEALVNYLVRLGWSCGDQEIFSMQELIEKFSLEAVGKSASVFNPEKLLWLNAHYIKHGDSQRLGELLTGHLVQKGIEVGDGPAPAAVVDALKERAKTLLEMAEQAACYYRSEVVFDPDAAAKFLVPALGSAFETLLRRMEGEGDWQESTLERAFEEVLHQTGLKFGKLAQPVRVALTGGSAGPGICQIMVLLGKERTLARLRQAIGMLA